MRILESSLQ
ncbi:hypothetical protein CGLO_11306 [Colletotrichum gloeosporioides Cg-14]|uniref:Uncharacterized protein n=1 Tax=Colletotrichum gloeosporioides (strain Cg-14) TaxID=1237896 RepID=T0K8K2_COLGC|nr:hypothetical protein CGLO_11306 [Colletotrichum gloeosporioides Cg-14]